MDFKEYKDNLSDIEKEYQMKKITLMKYFVDKNNPYKINDIVTDHIGSIKIEQIKYTYGFMGSAPCAVYNGVELKKDLTPVIKKTKRDVFQSNIIK